jgi:antitoxin component YwqK of YwqJK toxin-antitoxin module
MYTKPYRRPACTVMVAVLLFTGALQAQPDTVILAHDELVSFPDEGEDTTVPVDGYDELVASLGGDSVRLCAGYGCTGWVEDLYPNGQLKHRGFYNEGQLVIFKNYHPDGTLEREFKVVDNVKSQLRIYHGNGQLRSQTRYVHGQALEYEDHYSNGQLRYLEEKHREEPYYLRMDLFRPDGKPISTLVLVDKRTVTFEQSEFWPDGQVRCRGKARYDPNRMDTQRIGTWTYFDQKGQARFEEAYVDGKVHEVKPLLPSVP